MIIMERNTKRYLMVLGCVLCCCAAFCGSKMDLRAKAAAVHAKNGWSQWNVREVSVDGATVKPMGGNVGRDDEYVGLLIEVSDVEGVVDDVERLGGDVSGVYGNIVACRVPVDVMDLIEEDGRVVKMDGAGKRRLLNDKGREASASNVDAVHSGEGLAGEYRGKGVIVGLFDSGLDPNHINFYDDEQLSSRVMRVWKYTYNENTGRISSLAYTNPTAVSKFTTDDQDETHGTHVLGIMAGAYAANGYYGMAPESDIAIACGDAMDDAILNGVRNIVNYAESRNMPAVINLSLGSNCGHHDGTDAFTKALNEIAATTPIVLAAGNEADDNIVAKGEISSGRELKSMLVPTSYFTSSYGKSYQAYGIVEIISSSSAPFDLTIGLYDTSSKKIVASNDIKENVFSYFAGSSSAVDSDSEYVSNTVFSSAYDSDSYFGAAKGLCEDNGRYYALVDVDMYKKSSTSKYVPIVIVRGSSSAAIEMYSDGFIEFSSQGQSGFIDGTTDGTISDMACGKNTIAVGGYSTRSAYPYNDGTVGDVLSYSSYGKLLDGRELPHFCAPGQAIVSSMSTYYYSSQYYSSSYDKIYSTVTAASRKNYWSHMGGTSMAAPAAAGILALWLSADPTLTPAELRDIAVSTARKDSYVTEGSSQAPYQWGAGKIDAYAGLKEVIGRRAGVGNVVLDGADELLLRDRGDNCFDMTIPGASCLAVCVADMSGRIMISASYDGDNGVVDMSGLASGVYIVRCNGVSKKVMVR